MQSLEVSRDIFHGDSTNYDLLNYHKHISALCSLSTSHNPEIPWLAVGICLEKQHKPLEKLVRLIDWEKPQECCYSIQAGN